VPVPAARDQRKAAWLAVLAYMLLSWLHRFTLRQLAAPPPVGLVAGFHAAAFLAAAAATGWGAPGGRSLAGSLPGIAAVVAIEGLSWLTLSRLGSTASLALMVALLSGVAVPYTMAISRLVVQRRFAASAWVGAALVAAGVAYCNLGLLVTLPAASEAAVLVAACTIPGLGLVLKERLLVGSQTIGIPMVAALVSIVQLVAFSLPLSLSSATPSITPSGAVGGSALLAYIAVSGALRLSLVWAIRAASSPTVQLVNALAVPLGATLLASSQQRNALGLVAALVGAALYLRALPRRAPAHEAARAGARKGAPEGVRGSFMQEMRREAFMEERRLAEQPRPQGAPNPAREARLKRLKQRWSEEEQRQKAKDAARKEALGLGAREPQRALRAERQRAPEAAPSSSAPPLTAAEIKQMEEDEAYLGLGTMWKKWMVEHPEEWRKQAPAAEQADSK